MRIQVERSTVGKRNRIYLRSPYSPAIAARCKQIDGASWSAAGRHWSYPLSYGTCQQLRKAFGSALEIGPELWGWAAVERKRAAQLEAILQAEEWPIPIVDATEPKLSAALHARPFQTVAAAFCATARTALNGDHPGLGKTLETFGAIVEAGISSGPILVFCPVSAVESTWMREIWEWLPEDDVIPCVGNRKQRLEAFRELREVASQTGRRTWFICNIEMTRVVFAAQCPGPKRGQEGEPCDGEYIGCKYADRHKQRAEPSYPELFAEIWQAIVIDESHKALITTKSRRAKQSQKRVGFGMLNRADDALTLSLSGTPWRGKAENFWGTLNWLRPDIYPAYWRWAEKYFDILDDGFAKKIDQLKPEAEDDWNADLRSIMVRRTKQEVAAWLPPKQYAGTFLIPGDETSPHGVWLPMTGEQDRAYRAMQRDAAVRLDGGTLMGNGVLAEMMRLRQFANSTGRLVPGKTAADLEIQQLNFEPKLPSNKFDWLVDFCEERGIAKRSWGTGKVVIASQFTALINLFRAELLKLGIASHCLTGGTPQRERARQIAEFQAAGGPRLFLLNTQAGGVSVTLDAADELVLLDEPWIPDDAEQVEDRIHRISRLHNVIIYYVRSLGTIEEQIAYVAARRENIQKQLLDGARGVAFARRLIGV
jgi:Zierdtviridae DNA helicase